MSGPAPSVSVILNVRNGAAWLREALDSVVAQTYTDWELIFWDDHSTDGSARILDEYKDDRIHYHRPPEQTPLGPARDAAIRRARGDWLAFIDQDDIWLPGKLAMQMALTEGDGAADVGIVYGRTVMFSGRGRVRDFDHRHEYETLPEGDIFLRLFEDSCFISASCVVLRRSAFLEVGGIPGDYEVIPDYHLLVAIARRYRARAVQEVVCRYRLHDANMSHLERRRMHEEALCLVDAWAADLDPRLVARRRRIHHTLVGLDDACHLRTAGAGIRRILAHGSVPYLLSRPFVRGFRAVRRRVRRPYWRTASATVAGHAKE